MLVAMVRSEQSASSSGAFKVAPLPPRFLLCVVSAKRRVPISNLFILNRRKLILLVTFAGRQDDNLGQIVN